MIGTMNQPGQQPQPQQGQPQQPAQMPQQPGQQQPQQGQPQQSPERQKLIEAIVNQKLITEKENGLRNMQLQMETNPTTVAKQKEQELLNLTKQEVTAKLGPGIQQQGQQMAQAQAQQAALGIGGVPRPPMGMAAGGIVAFQGGGGTAIDPRALLTGSQTKTWEEKIIDAMRKGASITDIIKAIGSNPEGQAALSRIAPRASAPESAPEPFNEENLSDIPVKEQGIASVAPTPVTKAPTPETYLGRPVTPEMRSVMDVAQNQKGLEGFNQRVTDAIYGDSPVNPGYAGRNPPADPYMGIQDEARKSLASTEDLTNPLPPQPPRQEPAGIANEEAVAQATEEERFNQRMKDETIKLLDVDPEAKGLAALGVYDKRMGKSQGLADAYGGRVSDLEALLAQQQDPRRNKMDRLKATLLGMGGRTNAGSAFGGGLAASMNEQNRQDMDQRAGIGALATMGKSQYDMQAPIDTGGYNAYDTNKNRAETASREALRTGAGMANTDKTTEVGKETNRLRAVANALQQQNQLDGKTYAAIDRAQSQLEALNERVTDRLDTDQQYMMANAAFAIAMADDEQGEALKQYEKMQQARARIEKEEGTAAQRKQITTFTDSLYRRAGIPITGSSGFKVTEVK